MGSFLGTKGLNFDTHLMVPFSLLGNPAIFESRQGKNRVTGDFGGFPFLGNKGTGFSLHFLLWKGENIQRIGFNGFLKFSTKRLRFYFSGGTPDFGRRF